MTGDNRDGGGRDDVYGTGISEEPVNVLFDSHASMAKRDVWEIDLIQILEILMGILEKSGKQKDLRVAGMAAVSSSLIYRLKVETISALHKAAMERKTAPAPRVREDVDIEMIGIPYRHESTYPVSLDDLLALLQNLIGTMANPVNRSRRRKEPDILEPPPFEDYLLSFEGEIDAYRDMVMRKIGQTGRGILQDITENLSTLDAIRCFFAALFLARDGMVDLQQHGDEIYIVAIPQIESEDGDGADTRGVGPDKADDGAGAAGNGEEAPVDGSLGGDYGGGDAGNA